MSSMNSRPSDDTLMGLYFWIDGSANSEVDRDGAATAEGPTQDIE